MESEVSYAFLEPKSSNQDLEQSSGDISSESETGSLSDGDPESDSLDEIIADISTNTQILVDLQDAFEHPAPDCLEKGKSKIRQLPDPSRDQYYSGLISSKFPGAELSLIQDLGVQNWHRYQRRIEEIQKNSLLKSNTSELPQTAVPGTVVGTDFHDSGLGSSVPTQRAASPTKSYAETVTSFVGRDNSITRIPPLSEAAKAGEPFECIGCGKTIFIANKTRWK